MDQEDRRILCEKLDKEAGFGGNLYLFVKEKMARISMQSVRTFDKGRKKIFQFAICRCFVTSRKEKGRDGDCRIEKISFVVQFTKKGVYQCER